MSNKIEIDTLESLSANDASATLTINNNFKKIRDELNNTLSRDGKTPNFMNADIDLNSRRVINSSDPVDDKDLVTLKFMKKEIGDAKVYADKAQEYSLRSKEYAQDSKEAEKSAIQYAIGYPTEPANHSAKWWSQHPDFTQVVSRSEFESLEDTVEMHESDITQLETDKQDKLVAGDGISIEGNVIKNTQTSAEWGRIIGTLSDQTDLKNALDTLVADGVKNKNDNSAVYDWIGTYDEYVAGNIQTLHPDWLCFIVDETGAEETTYTKETIDNKLELKADANNVTSLFEQAKAFATATCSNILSGIYPVGSLYIGTQTTCPIASLIPGSSWELVGVNKALWGGNGSNATMTIDAGLPNITGAIGFRGADSSWYSGAVYGRSDLPGGTWDTTSMYAGTAYFDASRSSSVYGRSNTVQPPAYVVNIWRRIA